MKYLFFPKLLTLISHIDKKLQIKILILTFFMFIVSLAEVVSIGAVLPFLAILVNPENFIQSSIGKFVYEFLQIENTNELLKFLTSFFIIAALLAGTLRVLLLWTQTRISHSIGADISIKMYKVSLYQPYLSHLTRNSSYLVASITEKSNAVVKNVVLPILLFSSSLLMLISIILTLFFINIEVTIINILFFAIIYSLIIFFTKKSLNKNGHIINSLLPIRIKSLQEGFKGIRDVILNNNQKIFIDVFKSSDLPIRRAQALNSFISASPRYIVETFGILLISGFIFIMVSKGTDIQELIPIFGVFVFGAQRMLPLMQQTYANWSTIKGSAPILQSVLELLDQRNNIQVETNKLIKINFNDKISLKNISFGYPSENKLLFKDIDLTINKGSKVGIFGKTGSGKSTLIDIIAGLLKPKTGKLIIDNQIISEEAEYSSWMSKISYVPQNIFLADTSIKENIALGLSKNQIDLKKIEEVAKISKIYDSINEMDNKFDTLVGESGIRLSGGQRQRIGIARALYKKSDLIIFDEATNALDSHTEKDIMRNIYDYYGKDITILIVSHNLNTLNRCDHLLEINSNKIIFSKNKF